MTLNRTIPPPIHHAVEFDYKLPQIHTQQLDNGLPIYWLAAGVQEVCELTIVFPAGQWHEPKPLVAQATAALLRNGTATRSAHQLSEAIEFYGATLKASASNDYAIVSLYCLTRHLPALLPILREVLVDAAFPEEEVALFRQNSVQRLAINLRKCDYVANEQIAATIYGEAHPYGRLTTAAKIEAITREDLVAFHRNRYALAGAKIFLGGRIGATEVQAVNAALGSELAVPSQSAQSSFAPGAPGEQRQRIVNDEKGIQGAIRIGRKSLRRTDLDYPRLVVLNTLFGGYFGSRLMSNIREDKGYTYGIYSSLHSYEHGADMTIHTEAGREVCEAAIKEVYAEMERLRAEPAAEEELLLVKNYLLGGLLGDLDNPFQILARWRTMILNGQDQDVFNRNVSIYKSITVPEIQELANLWLKPEDFLELVVV